VPVLILRKYVLGARYATLTPRRREPQQRNTTPMRRLWHQRREWNATSELILRGSSKFPALVRQRALLSSHICVQLL
jgi:hypothetical protein